MQAIRLFTVLLVSFIFSAIADSSVAQTITHVPLYTFHGDRDSDLFGVSVSGAGDVNGDGRADLIVGASWDDDRGSASGTARVLSGSDGSTLYTFYGNHSFAQFGYSVSDAGDVNGDGMADLIVGAFGDGGHRGSAVVLSGIDGRLIHNFNGDNVGDWFGVSVSGAGDVTGDGVDDFIVGADEGGANDGGYARVLSGVDGSTFFTFDINSEQGFNSVTVSGAGDVNGDGRADLLVGAPEDLNNGFGRGSAHVLSGIDGSTLYTYYADGEYDSLGGSVSGAGDVNGDGFDDFIIGAPYGGANNGGYALVLSGIDGSTLYTFNGESLGDLFGHSVSGVGDVNGDGHADLIVGAPYVDNNGEISGSARVFSGSDGSILYTLNGFSAGDEFGYSVSGAGDVNGDGIDDFIVGTPDGGGYARVFVSQMSYFLLGDLNQDGFVNFSDIDRFIVSIFSARYRAEADINGDGINNFLDISPFIILLSSQ